MGRKITDFKQYIKDRTKINENGCWIWQQGVFSGGYGVAVSQCKTTPEAAQRVSYRAFKGQIGKGLLVLHRCDVKRCCNPEHLRVGNDQDNMDDRKLRGCNPENNIEIHTNSFGLIITPKGAFKTLKAAGNAYNKSLSCIYKRLKSPKYPDYYRTK